MIHLIQPIPFKPSRLIGLSERLLVSHYENNYGGAVRRLNAIDARLSALSWPSTPGFEINGLAREALVAANSMVLHEVYFESLGGVDGIGSPGSPPDGAIGEIIERDFGSYAAWLEQFGAMARALAGGSGWVILSWSPRQARLANHWASDHTQILAGSVPLLAIDMFEHAYHLDFGANAGGYVDAVLKNLHWDRAAKRLAAATSSRAIGSAVVNAMASSSTDSGPRPSPEHERRLTTPIAAEELRDLLAQPAERPLLVDVCLADDWRKRHDRIPGARYLPAETLSEWIETLPRDRPIVAYCVYGFQVSGDAVAQMRRRGLNARTLAGGIAAWHAIGAPTEPLDRNG